MGDGGDGGTDTDGTLSSETAGGDGGQQDVNVRGQI